MQLSRDIENAKYIDPQWTARFTRWAREAGAAERRIEDALTHFAIGQAAAGELLYVDWRYVAEQMAAALRNGSD